MRHWCHHREERLLVSVRVRVGYDHWRHTRQKFYSGPEPIIANVLYNGRTAHLALNLSGIVAPSATERKVRDASAEGRRLPVSL